MRRKEVTGITTRSSSEHYYKKTTVIILKICNFQKNVRAAQATAVTEESDIEDYNRYSKEQRR